MRLPSWVCRHACIIASLPIEPIKKMNAEPPARDPSFLELFGNRPLTELLADWGEVDLERCGQTWPDFPPAEFLRFCENYPRVPFDGIPKAPHHRKPPSFMLAQAHRMWLTTSKVHRFLQDVPGGMFIDLGSFPYSIPLIMRDYFGFQGRILATRNRELPPGSAEVLAAKRIESPMLDLDPYVRDPSEPSPASVLDLPDDSADVILLAHVIEHLYHPMSVLAECVRLLRPGGRLMVTTDNAMMIEALVHFVTNQGYISEPVEGTSAMTFGFWRGHVRLFTRQDLERMIAGAGLRVEGIVYDHVFYDALFPEYFETSRARLSKWKNEILSSNPQFRNEIAVVSVKPA